MADNGVELTRIDWRSSLPFTRLFETTRLALDARRLVLALAAVLLTYLGGCFLDGLWGERGGVVLAPPGGAMRFDAAEVTARRSEIEAFVSLPQQDYAQWLERARQARADIAVRTLLLAEDITPDEARAKLAGVDVDDYLYGKESYRQQLDDARETVENRERSALATLNQQEQDTAAERARVIAAADTLRRVLSRTAPDALITEQEFIDAAIVLTEYGEEPDTFTRSQLEQTARIQSGLHAYELCEPDGPFLTLLMFESKCFAAAIQGVLSGRIGFSGGALDAEPAMAGSIATAGKGIGWLIVRRPFMSIFLTAWMLVVFAYFGGGICRSAAVHSARDEVMSLGETMAFVNSRYTGFLTAPLVLIGFFIVVGLLLALGGLIGAIGYVGELFAGVAYPLALLGGFVMAMTVLVTILGFHLMWPTIAVEGSEGFDALSRSASYLSRIWHVLFYGAVLLIYGAFSFVIARLAALLTLKLAHSATKTGMNVISSAELEGNGKLDALWTMPAWADLSLLPSVGVMPFWGDFGNAPLDGFEWVSMGLLRIWIMLVVGLVGAFVVSYYYCGCTQMYFLLRRDVDATDYDEVYYEEPDDEFAPLAESGAPATAESTPAPAEPEQPPKSHEAEPPETESGGAEEAGETTDEGADTGDEGEDTGDSGDSDKPSEDEKQ